MKKKLLIAMSALLVLAFAAVVFAYNNSAVETQNAASHCEMMKNHHGATVADSKHKDSCCGMADCCKDGKCAMGGDCCKKDCCQKDKDSCPMKKDAQTTAEIDMKNVPVVGGDENCCKPGADCCKGGACCHKKV